MRAFLSFALAGLMATGAVSLEAPIPGYGVDTVGVEVEIAPGQTAVLNGTVQEIYAQALQLNPDFTLTATDAGTPAPQKKQKRSTVHCNNWPRAKQWALEDGVRYLRGVPGTVTHLPGPGKCARVSCSYQSAIWWCNDNTHSITLPSFNWIADSAQHTINVCFDGTGELAGQNFEDGNWNTILRHDNANC
ncbi:hypothetical protein VTI74DRAFT_1211 [Chaetomium olivicolor]